MAGSKVRTGPTSRGKSTRCFPIGIVAGRGQKFDPAFARALVDINATLTRSGAGDGDGSQMDRLPSDYPMDGGGGRRWSM